MNYIIIVSQDKSVIYSINIILKHNFIVEEVRNFERLLEVIYRRRPSLIFVDIPFDERDPMEILEEIKKNDPSLTVIFLFPSFNNIARECLENGAYDILEKPFKPDILLHKVKQVIEREKFISEKDETAKKEKSEIESKNIQENTVFQELFQLVANEFSNINILCEEVLKILRKNFHLSTQVIFLASNEKFIPFSSIGVEKELIDRLTLDFESSVIKYLFSKNNIVKVSSGGEIPFEVKNFIKVLNGDLLFPLKDFSGKLIGFFITGDKIDGEKLSSSEIHNLIFLFDYLTPIFENIFLYKEIEKQRNFQEKILQNIPAGVIGINREGRIFILNSYAEKILGVEFKNLKGEKIEKIGSRMADYLRRTLELEQTFEREEFNYISNKKTIGLSTSCIKDKNGEIIGAVAIFQDLTFIKEMKEKEREIEKSKYWASMASRLSHEMKNPLVAINTFVQLLPEKYSEEEFRNKFSKLVVDEVARLNGVVRKITELADRMELNYSDVNIVDLLKNSTKIFDNAEIKIKNDKIYAKIDPERFKEAIDYLFEFIKEDIGDKGKIEIEVEKIGDKSEILIVENGEKFNFSKEEEMFVPSSSHLNGAYSIGVMLAKKIIEAHNGFLKIEVTPREKIFKISLLNNIN